jgi:hypothetical protein
MLPMQHFNNFFRKFKSSLLVRDVMPIKFRLCGILRAATFLPFLSDKSDSHKRLKFDYFPFVIDGFLKAGAYANNAYINLPDGAQDDTRKHV